MTPTPGPWQVSPLDGRTCGPSRLLICNGTTLSQMQAVAIVTLRTGETEANARLIAAAPTMYDALKEAERTLLLEGYYATLQIIRAAIAMADGTKVPA